MEEQTGATGKFGNLIAGEKWGPRRSDKASSHLQVTRTVADPFGTVAQFLLVFYKSRDLTTPGGQGRPEGSPILFPPRKPRFRSSNLKANLRIGRPGLILSLLGDWSHTAGVNPTSLNL